MAVRWLDIYCLRSIEKEVNQIKKKQGRGGGQPLLESARDKDDVIQRYRRIEALFRQLQVSNHEFESMA